MSTSPAPAIQIDALRQEIADLRALQARHEQSTNQTDDTRLHQAHMRVASQLAQTVFDMENSLTTALRMIGNEGR